MESFAEMSTAQLVEIEREAIRRFRAKASELRAADPRLTPQLATAKAIQCLVKTSDRYMSVRQILQWRGVGALPLR